MKIAISGASGKTGYRIAEEAIKNNYKVLLLIRAGSVLPESLLSEEKVEISIFSKESLDQALQNCDSLIIATGARPSIDLTGPCKIDARGVSNQVESCKRVGIKRIILVSSLCTGRLIHPLNLFGFILLFKAIGEKALQKSGLDWTIIRPGGLNEQEDNLKNLSILYTEANTQEEGYIPRRLVAKSCIEALKTQESINQIIEITSSKDIKNISMKQAIQSFQG
ncbi:MULTISPECIES: SDR family oxidoreductase [Prochlorococcus]|uniref:SDR family oxidoreductase n=1 Tax=Prochlorococcus TaxID=1218 RepID=UPI0005336E46|nr:MULTISPECIES: SDR family oxidoreductase [Prochlorococcus]KGG12387.1 NAD dependent epimerase/dehydratase [Prochlorococcus sp. MIT 0601]